MGEAPGDLSEVIGDFVSLLRVQCRPKTHCELFSKLSSIGPKLSRIARYVDQTILETRVSASI
jgi:hypothetical protein